MSIMHGQEHIKYSNLFYYFNYWVKCMNTLVSVSVCVCVYVCVCVCVRVRACAYHYSLHKFVIRKVFIEDTYFTYAKNA